MDEQKIVLIYRGLLSYVGRWASDKQKEATQRFWREHPPPRLCWLCGHHVKYKDRSVDHVIPRNLCFEFGLVGLLFDERNFRIAHSLCNVRRGVLTIEDLPANVRDRLFVFMQNNKRT